MSDEAVLSVDLGGTNMRAAAVAFDGTVVARCSQPTPREATCPDALLELLATIQQGCRDTTMSAAVIGLPGRVNYEDGALEHAPNLPPTWMPDLTDARLGDALDRPVSLANDADLAAVGEAYYGAGQVGRDVVYITISTGVGAGVIHDGRISRGRRSLAEIGHTVISIEQALRGEAATVEQLGSGTALARTAAQAGLNAHGADLVALVRSGDTAAGAVWGRVIDAAAVAVVNLVHLFAPDLVVVGGGVGRNGELVLEPLRDALARHGPEGRTDSIDLVEAALGDDAGLVGAAAWQRAIGAVDG